MGLTEYRRVGDKRPTLDELIRAKQSEERGGCSFPAAEAKRCERSNVAR